VATDVPLTGPDALKAHVTEGFAAAADHYDADGTEFFQEVGRWLVDAAQVPAGVWVLDVGCGKGAVSIPAAQAAGPRGHVTGIDLASPMLVHAKGRAEAAGLANVSFTEGDAEAPDKHPGWPQESFDVVLAGNVLQFLPRPVLAVLHWYAVLMPGGTVGVAWTVAQDRRWVPVIAAVDAHVPDGVPAFGAYMRRPPFDDISSVEAMLTKTGYEHVSTTTRPVTVTYRGPEQWWATYQTQGPWALSWRHIPAERLGDAKRDAFAVLDGLREPDGGIARTLTFAFTTARRGTR
jgi:ubiquinone/menaquinone biosynthesis C-methylase UbiE